MIHSDKYAVSFACYNQVSYTRQCVESLIKHGLNLSRLVVVDNGSKDNTRAYLESLPLGLRIYNQENLGCGVAWNQGALALQAEWTVIMNNDVIVSANWLDNLIATAENRGLKIISPAMVEGLLDYDFDGFAATASAKMGDILRLGAMHAVCMAIHKSVWLDIGYFQPVPKLLGYEDTLFFNEATRHGIKNAQTGSSWLHHYGSITQSAIRQERGISEKASLSSRYNYRLLKKSWLERKVLKFTQTRQKNRWRLAELNQFGISLHGIRDQGSFFWK